MIFPEMSHIERSIFTLVLVNCTLESTPAEPVVHTPGQLEYYIVQLAHEWIDMHDLVAMQQYPRWTGCVAEQPMLILSYYGQ